MKEKDILQDKEIKALKRKAKVISYNNTICPRPVVGCKGYIYINEDTGEISTWNGTSYAITGGGSGSIDESNLVHKTGNESIAGDKTFIDNIEVNDGTGSVIIDSHSIKVDTPSFPPTESDLITKGTADYFYINNTGNEDIAGYKTFVDSTIDPDKIVEISAAGVFVAEPGGISVGITTNNIYITTPKAVLDPNDLITKGATEVLISQQVVGLFDDRGIYNPSITSAFPTSGGSGSSGSILKGDLWTVSGLGLNVSQSIGTHLVTDGDVIRALTDNPAQTDSNWAVSENNLGYTPVVANTAIVGSTKTKITYDSKGLVTNGVDATTADIVDSLDKRYVTDSQLTVISNTANINTGDETTISIQTKRPLKTVGGVSLEGSGDVPLGGGGWSTSGNTNTAAFILGSTNNTDVNINSGIGNLNLNNNNINGERFINIGGGSGSGSKTINIGNWTSADGTPKLVSIGTTATNSGIFMQGTAQQDFFTTTNPSLVNFLTGSGTSALQLATAGTKNVNLGSTVGSSFTNIYGGSTGVHLMPLGTGPVRIAETNQNNTISIGNFSTGIKTINIGGTGSSSVTNINAGTAGINIGNVNTTPINIATGNFANTVSIATGTGAKTVNIGSVTAGSTTTINSASSLIFGGLTTVTGASSLDANTNYTGAVGRTYMWDDGNAIHLMIKK
jgi:hypothetical protein